MQKILTKNKKLITGFFLVLVLLPTVLFAAPKQIFAQGEAISVPVGVVSDTSVSSQKRSWLQKLILGESTVTAVNTTKEWAAKVLQEVLRAVARKVLAQMTEATVNWINTGFHGAPLFVENPGSFFKDIAKSQIKELVNLVGYNPTSFPFGKNAALNTIASYKSTFEQNAQYSLSKVTSDANYIQKFQTDFSVGGWDGFLLQTQFPQNNPIGFNMMYSEELAKKLNEAEPASEAKKIKEALAQGQGFLSPQACPTNPKYNNLKNQFQKPTFKSKLTPPPYYGMSCDQIPDTSGQNIEMCEDDNATHDRALAAEIAAWNDLYGCPGGLVRTTPGAVVGAQIMKAITGPYDQASLAAAMGNSLSAIFDALINKFMSSGLNALSNKLNGTGGGSSNDDDFSYDGQTLGTDPGTNTTGIGFNWNGPDQVITAGGVRADVQNTIDNINKELSIINNTSPTTPGIFQTFEKIWPKAQELDMCLPGPDIGWLDRVETEVERVGGTTTSAILFQETVLAKMKAELPSSYSYITAVNSVTTTNAQNTALVERERALTEALIKLNSVNSEVSDISIDPEPGTTNESKLIQAKQRYDSIILDISTGETVVDAQNKLADAKDKLNSLSTLVTKCTAERTAKGWSNPGGANSIFGTAKGTVYTNTDEYNNYLFVNPNSEKYIFCNTLNNTGASCDVIYSSTIADYKR